MIVIISIIIFIRTTPGLSCEWRNSDSAPERHGSDLFGALCPRSGGGGGGDGVAWAWSSAAPRAGQGRARHRVHWCSPNLYICAPVYSLIITVPTLLETVWAEERCAVYSLILSYLYVMMRPQG